MIEFNLEKALAGEKVITRDGREVTQLTVFSVHDDYLPLVGVVYEALMYWRSEGTNPNAVNELDDLFMAPKKLSGFVNVYSDGGAGIAHRTKDDANAYGGDRVKLAMIDLSQFDEGHGLTKEDK